MGKDFRYALLTLVIGFAIINLMGINMPSAHGCDVFTCGPTPHPQVYVIYVDRPQDPLLNEAFRAIVEDGYLDAAPGSSRGVFSGSIAITVPDGILWDAEVQGLIQKNVPRGVIAAIVLGPRVTAVQSEANASFSYHRVANNVPYLVLQAEPADLPVGIIANQPLDFLPSLFAHELVEAVADKEIADPCDFTIMTYERWQLQAYQTPDGTCGMGAPSPVRKSAGG